MIAAALFLAAVTLPDVPAGAPVDRSEFQYARALGTIPRGAVSLALDAHVLLRSRELRDVRIVDAKQNQIPYLVTPSSPTVVPLNVPPAVREGKQSIYQLVFPDDSLPSGTQLELTTSVQVFERDIVLRRPPDESRGREPQLIEQLHWTSSPALRTNLAAGRAIEIVVDEGDNAALPIVSAKLLIPGFALRFVSPGAPLVLLYGNPSLATPRYDLALLSSQLRGQPVRWIALTGAPAEVRRERNDQPKLFGIAIGVAVIVLLIVLGRLVSAPRS